MASTQPKKFRVLIVDDSAFMRKVLETILNSDDQLQVVGQAKDGREAITLAESLKPDVITMDINMPHVDGLQATAQIMTTNPRPIVIVSSESREGAASTLKALELGAIEFVAKPSSGIDLDMQSVKDDLLRKVRMSAKVRVVRTASRLASAIQAFASNSSAVKPASPRHAPPVRTSNCPIGIALSCRRSRRLHRRPGDGDASGPRIHARLPCCRLSRAAHARNLHHAIRGAARRIHQHSRERSRAQRAVQPGTLYICPGAQHLRITPTGRIQLDSVTGRINGYLPNIDVTMETAAAYAGAMTIGVVLTGMGNDGARGAKAIKTPAAWSSPKTKPPP